MKNKRDDLDTYFMEICDKVAERSTCRVKLGCLIVKDKMIHGMGYVGSLSGDLHCVDDAGCLLVDNHGEYGSSSSGRSCIRTTHAEINALIKCSERGSQFTGWMTSYSTYTPCLNCFKALLSIGVRTFVYRKEYIDKNRDIYLNALKESIRTSIVFRCR